MYKKTLSTLVCASLLTACSTMPNTTQKSHTQPANHGTVTINNVRVFDGNQLTPITSVSFKDGVIINTPAKADQVIDGQGGTLLPGLIDSHIHLDGVENLHNAAKYGITTMIDLAAGSYELVDSLRNQKGLTDIRSSLRQVVSPYGPVLKQALGEQDFATRTPADAKKRIDEQIAHGADFIKIVIETPPLTTEVMPDETVVAAVSYAHSKGKQVFVHATRNSAYQSAVNSGADVLNHLPKDEVLNDNIIKTIKDKNLAVVPTLIMLQGLVNGDKARDPNSKSDMKYPLESLNHLYRSGVTIMAGTDANHGNKMNFVEHGETLHTEFVLMSQAGMSNKDILRSATIVPATRLKLNDRGEIKTGKRADLVLIKGNPLENIKTTQNIQKVWVNGVEVKR